MKTFPSLLRRQQFDPDPSDTAFDALDEKYEVLDADALWDEAARIPAEHAAAGS